MAVAHARHVAHAPLSLAMRIPWSLREYPFETTIGGVATASGVAMLVDLHAARDPFPAWTFVHPQATFMAGVCVIGGLVLLVAMWALKDLRAMASGLVIVGLTFLGLSFWLGAQLTPIGASFLAITGAVSIARAVYLVGVARAIAEGT